MILALVGAVLLPVPQTSNPDAEGFIRNWLVWRPLRLTGIGRVRNRKGLLQREATLKPKAGDKVAVGGKALTWTAHQTSDYFIDFLQAFGKERGEYVAGYAVAYVIADAEMKVTLALSTNDQGKAWVNGKQVFKFAETRTLEKDTDKIEVALGEGAERLVLKVINEVNNWQGCARFLKDGAPVKNIKIPGAPVGIARGVLTVSAHSTSLRPRLPALATDRNSFAARRVNRVSASVSVFKCARNPDPASAPRSRRHVVRRETPAGDELRPDRNEIVLYQSLSASENTKSNGPGSAGTSSWASPSRASM